MIFSPFLAAFHSFDSGAIVEKNDKEAGGKEGERERGGMAALVIRSAVSRGRERPRCDGGVPLCKTAQGSLKPLSSLDSSQLEGGEDGNVDAVSFRSCS